MIEFVGFVLRFFFVSLLAWFAVRPDDVIRPDEVVQPDDVVHPDDALWPDDEYFPDDAVLCTSPMVP